MSAIIDGTNGVTAATLVPSGSSAPTNGIYLPTTNAVAIATNSTNALYIDGSQNVGIGTSSPSNYGNTYIRNLTAFLGDQNITLGAYYQAGTGQYGFINSGNTNNGNAQPLVFQGGGIERMRIDSSGNLLVGKTTTSLGTGFQLSNATGNAYLEVGKYGTSLNGDTFVFFTRGGTSIGSITQNGTTGVLFNTTSDQRLKTNIVDAPSASSIIDAIQIRSFDWKSDGSHNRYGVIAQELNEIVPEAVHTPVEDDQMMGVDYSKLVPLLVKALQELKSEFDAYKASHP